MAFQPWICFLYCLSFSLVVCQNISGSNICMTPDSTSIRCCKDFYLKENKCIECEPGYVGTNCSSICPSGYFGRRCSERCQCSSDMYCEPTRGCLCNTSSVNCTQSEQEVTKDTTFSTIYQPNQIDDNRTEFLLVGILPFSIPVIVCFAIGMVCIRRASANNQNKNMHNVTDSSARAIGSATEDMASSETYNHLNLRIPRSSSSISSKHKPIGVREQIPSPELNTDVPFQDNRKDLHVNQHSLPTVCERNSDNLDGYFIMTHKTKLHDKTNRQQEERNLASKKGDTEELLFINSNEGQQKNGGKTVKFEYPEPIQDTAVLEEKPQKENLASPVCTFDEEVYANSCDTIYSNNLFISENQTDNEVTEIYFDVKYEGQKTNTESVRSSCSSKASKDMFDYINCSAII